MSEPSSPVDAKPEVDGEELTTTGRIVSREFLQVLAINLKAS